MKTVMLNIRGGTFEHLLLLRLILCEIFYLCLFCWNRLKQTRNRCPHCRGYSADFTIRSLHLDSLAGWEPKEIRGGKCTVCVRVCVWIDPLCRAQQCCCSNISFCFNQRNRLLVCDFQLAIFLCLICQSVFLLPTSYLHYRELRHLQLSHHDWALYHRDI